MRSSTATPSSRAPHTQYAPYLESSLREGEWNPSDYALHLTRRARGLPFWFSLVSHGAGAYAEAIETTLDVARAAAREIAARPNLELVALPMLSIVGFKRRGWSPADYEQWSTRLLSDGIALVRPSRHRGDPIGRLAIVNPRTAVDDVREILDTLG